MTLLYVSNCKTLRKLKNILVDELFEKVLVVMSPSTSLHLSVTSCYHPLPALQHPHTSQHSPSLWGGFSAYSFRGQIKGEPEDTEQQKRQYANPIL